MSEWMIAFFVVAGIIFLMMLVKKREDAKIDDQILLCLQEKGIASLTLLLLYDSLSVDKYRCTQRLRILEVHGYIYCVNNYLYGLTPKGVSRVQKRRSHGHMSIR